MYGYSVPVLEHEQNAFFLLLFSNVNKNVGVEKLAHSIAVTRKKNQMFLFHLDRLFWWYFFFAISHAFLLCKRTSGRDEISKQQVSIELEISYTIFVISFFGKFDILNCVSHISKKKWCARLARKSQFDITIIVVEAKSIKKNKNSLHHSRLLSLWYFIYQMTSTKAKSSRD